MFTTCRKTKEPHLEPQWKKWQWDKEGHWAPKTAATGLVQEEWSIQPKVHEPKKSHIILKVMSLPLRHPTKAMRHRTEGLGPWAEDTGKNVASYSPPSEPHCTVEEQACYLLPSSYPSQSPGTKRSWLWGQVSSGLEIPAPLLLWGMDFYAGKGN